MNPLIRLELKKQRLSLLGLAAAIAISLPLVALAASWSGSEVRQSLRALMLFWTALGLPVMAALFGASAGAGLRAEPAAGAESALPVLPQRRAGAALLCAAISFLTVSALVLICTMITNGEGRGLRLLGMDWARHFFDPVALLLGAFTLTHILIVSFVCAYALGHGLAGGLAGFFVGGISLSIAIAWAMQAVVGHFGDRDIFRPGTAWTLVLLCLGGGLYALRRATSRLERHAGLRRTDGAIITVAMLAGSALSLLTLGGTYARLTRAPQPLHQDEYYSGQQLTWIARRLLPGLDKAATQGYLTWTLDGDLILFTPHGKRVTLVPGTRHGLLDFNYTGPGDFSTQWDQDGSLWVLACDWGVKPGSGVLLHGRPGGRFETHWTARQEHASIVVRRGRELGLIAWTSAGAKYAPLPAKGREPAWRSYDTDRGDLISSGWVEAGLALTPEQEHGTVARKIPGGGFARWRLPSKAKNGPTTGWSNHDFFPAISPEPKSIFALNISLDKGDEFALCKPDGSVTVPWPGSDFRIEGLSADGTLWGWRDQRTILMLKPDGTAAPPFEVSKKNTEPNPLPSQGARESLAHPAARPGSGPLAYLRRPLARARGRRERRSPRPPASALPDRECQIPDALPCPSRRGGILPP